MSVTIQSGVPASSGGGAAMTLLGTLTTTSGATQSVTAIAAGYREFYCELDGVSPSSNDTLQVKLGSGSTSYGAAASISATVVAANSAAGFLTIGNVSSTVAAAKTATCAVAANGAAPTVFAAVCPTGTAAVATAIQFLWSGGANFDAGEIRVYGVK